jgi:hypothetical protein
MRRALWFTTLAHRITPDENPTLTLNPQIFLAHSDSQNSRTAPLLTNEPFLARRDQPRAVCDILRANGEKIKLHLMKKLTFSHEEFQVCRFGVEI